MEDPVCRKDTKRKRREATIETHSRDRGVCLDGIEIRMKWESMMNLWSMNSESVSRLWLGLLLELSSTVADR